MAQKFTFSEDAERFPFPSFFFSDTADKVIAANWSHVRLLANFD